MPLKLWQQVNLSLLLPILISAAIVLYAVFTLGTISNRIDFMERADDINLTLLELRRYEKNIVLFKEEQNITKFYEHLRQLDTRVGEAERQIVEEINKQSYKPLLANIETYKDSGRRLIRAIKTEQELLEQIRPLGRTIENSAARKDRALDLRRFEKNYIIYGERSAVEKVHRIAEELVRSEPGMRPAVLDYTRVFDSLTRSEAAKDGLIEAMRQSGRAIEKITLEFSQNKRNAIDKTIASSRRLLIVSLVFLIVSTITVACLFSTNVARTLKTMEKSFARLKEGDFAYGIDVHSGNAPREILSFAQAYNQTIDRLGESKAELDITLAKIEITNRELIERQDELVEARKLSAMRLLAAEIAHEINNPLSSLTVFLRMFYEDMRDDDTKKEALTLMIKEVDRCQAVLRELVDFARKEPLKFRKVNPSELVREAVDIVCEQHRDSRVRISASLDGLPESAVLDSVLIYQALVNILTNAYQVTPSGGTIDIAGRANDDMMTIVVKDSGPGIAEEYLPLIFDPFFSTRKEAGGHGLGLAITRKIIERHSGSIRAESRPGKGTAITIQLPVMQEQA